MTHDSFVRLLAKRWAMPIKLAKRISLVWVEVVRLAVVKDGRLAIPGFGVFRLARHKRRRALNPSTGKGIRLPAFQTIRFRPSRNLRLEAHK